MRSPLHLVVAALTAVLLAACADDRHPLSTPIDATAPNQERIYKFDPSVLTAISAGDDFTCVLQSGGGVYCWGRGDKYQVRGGAPCYGHDAFPAECVIRPSRMYKPSGEALLAIRLDAGGAHACVIDVYTQVWCWGAGNEGQLGQNDFTTSRTPLAVPGMSGASLIGAGQNSTCAQVTLGTYCWGRISSPSADTVHRPDTPAPVQWSGFAGFVDLSVGLSHACAIEAGSNFRRLHCWGMNKAQTADPSGVSRLFPTTTTFGSAVTRVATQASTTCIERSGGTMHCTGTNDSGIFGTPGAPSSSINPIPVNTTQASGPLHGISVGRSHACGLDRYDNAWCWGNGSSG